MATLLDIGATADARVAETIRRIWGFDGLRPLQAEAISAALERRDSLVVMPTGGGKSLCYQVPPLVEESTTVVVSPLLSLIKDQVDGLREAGVAALALHGSTAAADQREAERDLLNGRVRILFTTPERALSRSMAGLLSQARVRAVAIDEAHCISHWGHDFRPEYRRLRELREALPDVALHAFTATATQRVRDDIIAELGLRDPAVLVGSFDRPNLVYRVLPRRDEYGQVVEVLKRHKGEAAIIYCITRRETESLATALKADGFNAAAYHAGLAPEVRRGTQDAFAREALDIVVATVAFGMGIDRSNVRCVIHDAMPKSVEHYQQEAGRAGRDGLPAECVLLYSSADVVRWESVMSRAQDDSAGGDSAYGGNGPSGGPPGAAAAVAAKLLDHMRTFCCAPGCRHRRLVEYFDQAFERDNCGACDACLGEIEVGDDERVVAQKILSCVARVKERFGVGHVVDVLTGGNTARVAQFEHDKLSTYGLLRELGKARVTSLVNQLLDQGLLARRTMEIKGMSVPVLALNDASWEVLRNQRAVHFRKDADPVQETASEAASWEGVDRELFDALRDLRRRLAEERGVAPFVLFHDSTLRSLARVRPSTLAALGAVRGIGERKVQDLGSPVLDLVSRHVRERSLAADQPDRAPAPPAGPRKASTSDIAAGALFAKGASVAEVCTQMGRAQSTVYGYLEQYILRSKPARVDAWIDDASYAAIAAALEKDTSGLLRPVFEALGGAYSYQQIRIVGAHRRSEAV